MLAAIQITIRRFWQIRALRVGLKIAFMLLLLGLLYLQLLGGAERLPWAELQSFWQERFSWTHLLALLAVFALMPFNWILETKKWVKLMHVIEPIGIWTAFRAVLAGLTVSMFTPNRMGEYGGRVLMVRPENRVRSVCSTLVGSMSQWLVIVAGGLLGLSYLLLVGRVPESLVIYGLLVLGLAFLGLLFVGFCYFNLSWFSQFAMRWRWTRKWAQQLHQDLFQHYQYPLLRTALLLSGLRYLIYSLQYFCLLSCFGFEMNALEGYAAIVFVFLLQTGLPVPPSAGLLARGSLAVWVFGWFLSDAMAGELALQSAILASTFSLWFINLLLPAAIGGCFIAGLGIRSVSKQEAASEEEQQLLTFQK